MDRRAPEAPGGAGVAELEVIVEAGGFWRLAPDRWSVAGPTPLMPLRVDDELGRWIA